jgi:hypothetical protein
MEIYDKFDALTEENKEWINLQIETLIASQSLNQLEPCFLCSS